MHIVDLEEFPNAQVLAGHLKQELVGIKNQLMSEFNIENPPSPMIYAYLSDNISILDSIENGIISVGSSRIVSNMLAIVDRLDETSYREESESLVSLLESMSQYGISLDGFPLGPSKAISRASNTFDR